MDSAVRGPIPQEAAHIPEDADPSYFMRWSRVALQNFVTKYGFPCSGTKAALAAEAFVIISRGFQTVPDKEQLLIQKHLEYVQYVNSIDGLSDPFLIESGWVSEHELGYEKWPAITVADIVLYLSRYAPDGVERSVEEYKKGYALHKRGFLHTVDYLQVNDQMCVLRSCCTPEERVNDAAYEGWAAVLQDGKILGAYCTCTGGMGHTCKHIQALLFRCEECVAGGYTDNDLALPPTSRLCAWNVPGKVNVSDHLLPVDELLVDWQKPEYKRDARKRHNVESQKKSVPMYSKKRHTFDPVTSSTKKTLPIREKYVKIVKKNCPNAVVLTTLDSYVPPWRLRVTADRVARASGVQTAPRATSPPGETPTTKADKYHDPPTLSDALDYFRDTFIIPGAACGNVDGFIHYLGEITKNPYHVTRVEEATRGQADNNLWREHRLYCLTASNFGRICSRYRSQLRSKTIVDMSKLLQSLVSPKDLCHLPAIKYGRKNEPLAVNLYAAKHAAIHDDSVVTPCGLFLHKDFPGVGASPDGLSKCSCHGSRILEIKCPLNCEKEAPNVDNCKFLIRSADGELTLKKAHPYYYQVQGQMAITGVESSDFLVYSPVNNGEASLIIPVDFNGDFWKETFELLCGFYKHVLAPFLLFGREGLVEKCNEAGLSPAKSRKRKPVSSSAKTVTTVKLRGKRKAPQPVFTAKMKKTDAGASVDVCPICQRQCMDLVADFGDNTVCCDWCEFWFHYRCVGILTQQEGDDVSQSDSYFCPRCISKKT